jgi:dihydroneopterin aldolase
MRGQLFLSGIILRLKLGAEPGEKISRRDIPVDITWSGEVITGMSVDYSKVCSLLAGVQEMDFLYLEDLASHLLGILRHEFPGGSWKVTVRKPFPPVSLRINSASFTLEGEENA